MKDSMMTMTTIPVDGTLLFHSLVSVLLVMAAAVCFGFFFSYIRRFAAAHNPLGANLINYVTFIGVVHHELSHALLAFLTGAKVTEVKVFRINHKDGRLGYVSYEPRGNFIMMSIQKVFASVAPILMGFVSCSLLYLYILPMTEASAWGICLFYYVFISIVLHMSLSKQDIQVMKGGIIVVILLFTIVFYVLGRDFVAQIETWKTLL